MFSQTFALTVLGAVVAAGGVSGRGADDTKRLDARSLETPKLLNKVLRESLERDYKGKRGKEKAVAALEVLAPLDALPDKVTYSAPDGKPSIIFDARGRTRPDNASTGEAALK